jgi:hypothetical protein
LRRYCSGRFVDQVPHIGEGRKLHAGVSLSMAKRCARLKRTNCTNREGRQKSAVYSPSLRRELFACRCCSGLAYASQQKDPLVRNVSQSQKIRMRLGGRPDDLLGPIPQRPRRCGAAPMSVIARRWPVSKAICSPDPIWAAATYLLICRLGRRVGGSSCEGMAGPISAIVHCFL